MRLVWTPLRSQNDLNLKRTTDKYHESTSNIHALMVVGFILKIQRFLSSYPTETQCGRCELE